MSSKNLKSEPFFFYYNTAILIIVVCGFGINALINLEKLPPASPIVFIHGACMVAWYALIVIQAGLIRSGNHALHITLGKSSIILAIGILISGIIMTLESYTRSANVGIVTVNIFIFINFIILYTLALYRRKISDLHKRLMLFASLAMILPALGRITQAMNINDFLSIPMWLLLLFIPLIYDFRSLKKVHKATLLGIILIVLGIAFTVGLMESTSWAQFLKNNIG
jgi:hypothetical protein